MCAVGIVPADQAYEAEDLTLGHRTLLRLVSCRQEMRVGKTRGGGKPGEENGHRGSGCKSLGYYPIYMPFRSFRLFGRRTNMMISNLDVPLEVRIRGLITWRGHE